MKYKKIKFEVKKGKVGKFDLYIFPGRQVGGQAFPAFCVLLRVDKRFKGGVMGHSAVTSVMN